MTRTKPFDNLRRQIDADPARRARVETMKRAMRDASALARLRESRGMTQVTLADTLGVSQSNVSRIEREDDLYLSTLRGYVEALGGRLHLAVVFPDETIYLGDEDETHEAGGLGGTTAVVGTGEAGGLRVDTGTGSVTGSVGGVSAGEEAAGAIGTTASGEAVLRKRT